MRVKVVNFNRSIETDLETALRPGDTLSRVGYLEAVHDQALANSAAIGRLLAYFVEVRGMSIHKAAEIAGRYEEIIPLKE